eukprot:3910741-Pyramimonas_sp.AAC.1
MFCISLWNSCLAIAWSAFECHGSPSRVGVLNLGVGAALARAPTCTGVLAVGGGLAGGAFISISRELSLLKTCVGEFDLTADKTDGPALERSPGGGCGSVSTTPPDPCTLP